MVEKKEIQNGIKRKTKKENDQEKDKTEMYFYEKYTNTDNWVIKSYYQNKLIFNNEKYIKPEFRNEFIVLRQKNRSRAIYSASICTVNAGISFALFQNYFKNRIYFFTLGVYFFTFGLNMRKTILLTNDFSKKMIDSGFLDNFNKKNMDN